MYSVRLIAAVNLIPRWQVTPQRPGIFSCRSPVLSDTLWFDPAESTGRINWARRHARWVFLRTAASTTSRLPVAPEPEPEQVPPVPAPPLHSNLRPLSIGEGGLSTELVADSGREVTLYVRGFMSVAREETADEDTAAWRRSHAQLVRAHGWQPRAMAYEWKSVGVPEMLPSPISYPLEKLRFLPLPAMTMAAGARIAAVLLRARFGAAAATGATLGPLAAGALAADVLLHAGRLVVQYRQAAANSQREAEQLRQILLELRRDYDVVRVVAHSLGSRMLLHACQTMTVDERPDEAHLLAAAVQASEAAPLLSRLARGETHVYFSRDDLCLGVAFRVIEGGPALGYSGLADVTDDRSVPAPVVPPPGQDGRVD
eukprot:COSAG02_NODE_15328_length_1181_cov_1.321627_1_plen_371_part_01